MQPKRDYCDSQNAKPPTSLLAQAKASRHDRLLFIRSLQPRGTLVVKKRHSTKVILRKKNCSSKSSTSSPQRKLQSRVPGVDTEPQCALRSISRSQSGAWCLEGGKGTHNPECPPCQHFDTRQPRLALILKIRVKKKNTQVKLYMIKK